MTDVELVIGIRNRSQEVFAKTIVNDLFRELRSRVNSTTLKKLYDAAQRAQQSEEFEEFNDICDELIEEL